MASSNGAPGGSASQKYLFDDANYDRDFKELQEYIPFVLTLMKRTGSKQGLGRLQSLHDMLQNDKARMTDETMLKCRTVLKSIKQRMGVPDLKIENSTESSTSQEKTDDTSAAANDPVEQKGGDRSMMLTLKLAAARTARNSGVPPSVESPSSSSNTSATEAKQDMAIESSLERSRDKLKMLLPFSPHQEDDVRSPRNFESVRLHPDSPRNDWDFQATDKATPKSPIGWNPYPPEDVVGSPKNWQVIDEYKEEDDTIQVPHGSKPMLLSPAKQTVDTSSVNTHHSTPLSRPLPIQNTIPTLVNRTVSVQKALVPVLLPKPVSAPLPVPAPVPKPVSIPTPVPAPYPQALSVPVSAPLPVPAPVPKHASTPTPVLSPHPKAVPPVMEHNFQMEDHDPDETIQSSEARSLQQSLRAKLSQEIIKVHRVGTSTGGSLRGLASKDAKAKLPNVSKEAASILERDKNKASKKSEKIVEIDMFSKETISLDKKAPEKNESPKVLKGLYAPRFGSQPAHAIVTSPKPNTSRNKASTERILKSPVNKAIEVEVKKPSRFTDIVAASKKDGDCVTKNAKGNGILANMTQEEIKRAVDLNLRNLPSPPTISPEILDSGKRKSMPPQSTSSSTEVRPAPRSFCAKPDVGEHKSAFPTPFPSENSQKLHFPNVGVGSLNVSSGSVATHGIANNAGSNMKTAFSHIPRSIVDNCFPSSTDVDLRVMTPVHSNARSDPRLDRSSTRPSPYTAFDSVVPSAPYDQRRAPHEDQVPHTPRFISYEPYQQHPQQRFEDLNHSWGSNTPGPNEQYDMHSVHALFSASPSVPNEKYGTRESAYIPREEQHQSYSSWKQDSIRSNRTDVVHHEIPLAQPNRHSHPNTNQNWTPQPQPRNFAPDSSAVPGHHQPFVASTNQRIPQLLPTHVDRIPVLKQQEPLMGAGNKHQVEASSHRGSVDRSKSSFEPASHHSATAPEFRHDANKRSELGHESSSARPDGRPTNRVNAVPRYHPQSSYQSRNERLPIESQQPKESSNRRRSVEQKDQSNSRKNYSSSYRDQQLAIESRRKSYEKERASKREAEKKHSSDLKQTKEEERVSLLTSLYGSTIPKTGQGYGIQKYKIPKKRVDIPPVIKPKCDPPKAETPKEETPKPVVPKPVTPPPTMQPSSDTLPETSVPYSASDEVDNAISQSPASGVNEKSDVGKETPQASTSKVNSIDNVFNNVSKSQAKYIFNLFISKFGKGNKLKEFLFEPEEGEEEKEEEEHVKKDTLSDKKGKVKASSKSSAVSNKAHTKSSDVGGKMLSEEEDVSGADGDPDFPEDKVLDISQDTSNTSRGSRNKSKTKLVEDVEDSSDENVVTRREIRGKKPVKPLDVEDDELSEPDQIKPVKPPKAKRRNHLEMLQDDIYNMFIRDGVLQANGRRMSKPFKDDVNRHYNQLAKEEKSQQDASADEDLSTSVGSHKNTRKGGQSVKVGTCKLDKKKRKLQKKKTKKSKSVWESHISSDDDISDVTANERFDSDDSDVEVKLNEDHSKMTSDKENKDVMFPKPKTNLKKSKKVKHPVTDLDKSFDELLRHVNVDLNKSSSSNDADHDGLDTIAQTKRVSNFDSTGESEESVSKQNRSVSRGPILYSSDNSDDEDRRPQRRSSPAHYFEDFSDSDDDMVKRTRSKKTRSIGKARDVDVCNAKREDKVKKQRKSSKKATRPKSRAKIVSSDTDDGFNSGADEDIPRKLIPKADSIDLTKFPSAKDCIKPVFLVLKKIDPTLVTPKIREFDDGSNSDSTFEQIPLSKITGPLPRCVARRGGKGFSLTRVFNESSTKEEKVKTESSTYDPDQRVTIQFRAGRKTSKNSSSIGKSINDIVERLKMDIDRSKTSDVLVCSGSVQTTTEVLLSVKRHKEISRKLFSHKLERLKTEPIKFEPHQPSLHKDTSIQTENAACLSSRKSIQKKRKKNNWSQGVIKKKKNSKCGTDRGKTRSPDPTDDELPLSRLLITLDNSSTGCISITVDKGVIEQSTEGEEQLKTMSRAPLNIERNIESKASTTDVSLHIEKVAVQGQLTEGSILTNQPISKPMALSPGVFMPATDESNFKGATTTDDEVVNVSCESRSADDNKLSDGQTEQVKSNIEIVCLEGPKDCDQVKETTDEGKMDSDDGMIAAETIKPLSHGIRNVDVEYSFKEEPSTKYRCKLCSFYGVAIILHYVQFHSSEEPYISRLSADKAECAIAESKEHNYDDEHVKSSLSKTLLKKQKKSDFTCRICFYKSKNAVYFYDHCCSHTGEYNYSCDECQQKCANATGFRSHVQYHHRHLRGVKPVTSSVLIKAPPPNTGTIFGYMCSSCNFVQMLKANVEKHVQVHHSDESSPEIVCINMHVQTTQTRRKLRKPRKSVESNASDGQPAGDLSAELMSASVDDARSTNTPQPDVNLTVFVPTDVRDDENEMSILEKRKNMLEEITKNLTNKGFLNREKRSSLFDVLSKRTRELEESPVEESNGSQSYGEESLSIGADEASYLVAHLEQNTLMDGSPRVEDNDDNEENVSSETTDYSSTPSSQVPAVQSASEALSSPEDEPSLPQFGSKRVSDTMDSLIERLKQSTTAPASYDLLPSIKQEHDEAEEGAFPIKTEPDEACGVITVGPLEAKRQKNSQLFSCLVAGCVFSSINPERFVLHVVSGHASDTWNGRCQTCNLKCHSSAAIPQSGGRFKLDLAVLHLLKSHLLLETRAEVARDEQAAQETRVDPPAAVPEESGVEPPVFRIRMRRLSGDKLSVAKEAKEPDEEPAEMMPEPAEMMPETTEACDDDDTMPCVIENVVSLAEDANAILELCAAENRDPSSNDIDPEQYTFLVTTPERNTSVELPLELSPPIEAQAACDQPSSSQHLHPITINLSPETAHVTSAKEPDVSSRGEPALERLGALDIFCLGAEPSDIVEIPTRNSIPRRVPTPIPPKDSTSAPLTLDMISTLQKVDVRKPLLPNIAAKKGPHTSASKNIKCFQKMTEPRKLRHLYKCVESRCAFTSNNADTFSRHLRTHRITSKNIWLQCSYCYGNKFDSREELVNHIQAMHGICQYQCAYCFYRAVVPSYVVLHQNTLHLNERISILMCKVSTEAPVPKHTLSEVVCQYRCNQGNCNSAFYLTSEFVGHLVSEHSQLHIYSCHICDSQVFSSGRLISHYKLYHSFSMYQCTHCIHGTDTEEAMHHHLSKIHPHLQPRVVVREWQGDGARTGGVTQLRVVDLEEANKVDETLISKPTATDLEEEELEEGEIFFGAAKGSAGDDSELVIDVDSVPSSSVGGLATDVDSVGRQDKTVDVILLDVSEDEASAAESGASSVADGNESSNASTDCASSVTRRLTRSSPQKTGPRGGATRTADDGALMPRPKTTTVPAAAPSPGSFEFGGITTEELARTGKVGAELNRCGYAKCTYASEQQSELRDHLMMCDNSRDSHSLVCPHCERSMKNVSVLLEHLKVHGTARYGCGLCVYRSTTARMVSVHLKTRHRVAPTKCIPLNPFKTHPEMDLFVVGPTKEKANRWGRKVANSPPKAKRKYVYQPNEADQLPMDPIYSFNVTCGVCSFTTKVRINMERHLAFHDSGVTAPSQTPVNAVPCLEKNEMMFDKMTNLAASSNMYKPSDASSLKLTSDDRNSLPLYVPDQERFVCGSAQCTYSSCDETMLLHHLRALHHDDDYVCPHCVRSSARLPDGQTEHAVPKDRISVHLKMHDTRLYKCGHCYYFDYRRYIVERHCTEKHRDRKSLVHAVREPHSAASLVVEDEEPAEKESTAKEAPTKATWQCGLCDTSYATRSEVMNHAGSVHNTKSQFKCSMCEFRSSSLPGVDVHYLSKHPGEERDFARVYYRVDVPSTEPAAAFDTSPLWSRDLPRVKHIRGILFDDGKDKKEAAAAAQAAAAQEAAAQVAAAQVAAVPEIPAAAAVGKRPLLTNTFHCTLCDNYVTKIRADMMHHLFKEMKYMRYFCTHCQKKSVARSHLIKHLKKVHTFDLKPDSFEVLPVNEKVEKWVEDYLDMQENLMALRIDTPSDAPPVVEVEIEDEEVDVTNVADDHSDDEVLIKASPIAGTSRKREQNKKLPKTLPCKHCKEKFSTIRGLKLHIRFAHLRIGKWKCNSCTMTHNAKVFVERHSMSLHPTVKTDMASPNPQLGAAPIIDAAFWEREYGIGPDFNANTDSSDGATPSKQLKLTTFDDSTDSEDVTKCLHCEYRTNNLSDMKRHRKRHWKQKPYKCGHCDFNAIREFEIKKHSVKIHPKRQIIVIPNEMPAQPDIQPIRTKRKPDADDTVDTEDECPDAKMMKTHSEEMIEFVIVGSGDSAAEAASTAAVEDCLCQCLHCEFIGSSRRDVYEHWESAHKEPVLVLDGTCKAGTGLAFEVSELRDCEMFTREQGEPHLACMHCKFLGTPALVVQHMKAVHAGLPSRFVAVTPVDYKCNFCDFKTKEVGLVRTHVIDEHARGQRDTTAAEANRYHCLHCELSTATRNGLMQHHNNSHPELDLAITVKRASGIAVAGDDDTVTLFHCPCCNYVHPDYRYMREHLKRHVRPYQCGHCPMRAAFPGQVYRHSAASHPGLEASVIHLKDNEAEYKKTLARVTTTREKRDVAGYSGAGVARKSTTKRPQNVRRSLPVARKSTGNSPRAKKQADVCIDLTEMDDDDEEEEETARRRRSLKPFSFYGVPRVRPDLGKLTMRVTFGGTELPNLRVAKYAEIFDIDPVVEVEDCDLP